MRARTRNTRLVLANPPFAGSLDYETVAKDLLAVVKTKKTELLFLALFLRLLKPGGRAAVIVPDGVLFGSSNAHKTLRRTLVEDQKLDAVISLPSGVFKPYAGVSTAILIFTKTNSGGTDHVWFYDVEADGWSPRRQAHATACRTRSSVPCHRRRSFGRGARAEQPTRCTRALGQRNGTERERLRTAAEFHRPRAAIAAERVRPLDKPLQSSCPRSCGVPAAEGHPGRACWISRRKFGGNAGVGEDAGVTVSKAPRSRFADIIDGVQAPEGASYNTLTAMVFSLWSPAPGDFGERYSRMVKKYTSPIPGRFVAEGDIIPRAFAPALCAGKSGSDRDYCSSGAESPGSSPKKWVLLTLRYPVALADGSHSSVASDERERGLTSSKQVNREDIGVLLVIAYFHILSEQQRIAEVLDRTEALRGKGHVFSLLRRLEELGKSIYLDMFGGSDHQFEGLAAGKVLFLAEVLRADCWTFAVNRCTAAVVSDP